MGTKIFDTILLVILAVAIVRRIVLLYGWRCAFLAILTMLSGMVFAYTYIAYPETGLQWVALLVTSINFQLYLDKAGFYKR